MSNPEQDESISLEDSLFLSGETLISRTYSLFLSYSTKVFLEIDNRQCAEESDQCFKNTEAAAALLAAQAIKGMVPYPFVSVESKYH